MRFLEVISGLQFVKFEVGRYLSVILDYAQFF